MFLRVLRHDLPAPTAARSLNKSRFLRADARGLAATPHAGLRCPLLPAPQGPLRTEGMPRPAAPRPHGPAGCEGREPAPRPRQGAAGAGTLQALPPTRPPGPAALPRGPGPGGGRRPASAERTRPPGPSGHAAPSVVPLPLFTPPLRRPPPHHGGSGAFLTDLFPGEGRRGAQRTAVSQEAVAAAAAARVEEGAVAAGRLYSERRRLHPGAAGPFTRRAGARKRRGGEAGLAGSSARRWRPSRRVKRVVGDRGWLSPPARPAGLGGEGRRWSPHSW